MFDQKGDLEVAVFLESVFAGFHAQRPYQPKTAQSLVVLPNR